MVSIQTLVEALAELADGRHGGEVALAAVDVLVGSGQDDLLARLLALLQVAAGHDHLGSALRQIQRRFFTDARVGAFHRIAIATSSFFSNFS